MSRPAQLPEPESTRRFHLLPALVLFTLALAFSPPLPGFPGGPVVRGLVSLVLLAVLAAGRAHTRWGNLLYTLFWALVTFLVGRASIHPVVVGLLLGWPIRRSLAPWIERQRSPALGALLLVGLVAPIGLALLGARVLVAGAPAAAASAEVRGSLDNALFGVAQSWIALAALRALTELMRRWIRRAAIRTKLVVSFGLFAVTPAVLAMLFVLLSTWVHTGEFRASAFGQDLGQHSAAGPWMRRQRQGPAPHDGAELARRLGAASEVLADRGFSVAAMERPAAGGWRLAARAGSGSDSLFLPASAPITDSGAVLQGLVLRDGRFYWTETALWPGAGGDSLALVSFEPVDSLRLDQFAREMRCDIYLAGSPRLEAGGTSITIPAGPHSRVSSGQGHGLQISYGAQPHSDSTDLAALDSLRAGRQFTSLGVGRFAHTDERHPFTVTPNAGADVPCAGWTSAGRWHQTRAVVLVHSGFFEFLNFRGNGSGPLSFVIRIILFTFAGLFLIVEVISVVFGSRVAGFITRGVTNLRMATAAVGRGDFSVRVQVPSEDEFGELAGAFNSMAQGLAAGQEAMVEREQLRREMELARRIQTRLLPAHPPTLARLDVAASNSMSQEVGGDYYDFVSMGDGRMGLCIADVSGKGVGAALLMSSVKAALISSAGVDNAPGNITSRVNQLLEKSIDPGKFVTFFFASLDPRTLVVEYVNAGHPAPMLLHPDGRLERLECGGTILGIDARAAYDTGQVALQPGDMLALFTDGLTEAQAESGDLYGDERIEENLRAARGLPAAGILDRLVQGARDFEGVAGPSDDLTVMVVRVLS